jgi:hypothetical protein
MKDIPTLQEQEPTFKLRYHRSGLGVLVFCVKGGYRAPNAPPRFRPKPKVRDAAATENEGPTEEVQAEVSAKEAYRLRRTRAVKDVKKAMDELIFSLSVEPNIEGMLLLDEGVWPWLPEPVKLTPDLSDDAYWLLEDEPDLKLKVLSKLRASLKHHFPQGWFVYRWHLSKRDYRPRLYLRLLGHLGLGVEVDAAAIERIRGIWAKATGGDPDLADVHPAPEYARSAFTTTPEWKFLPNLQHILKGGYIFGKVMKKNMPLEPMEEREVSLAEWERLRADLIRRYLSYKGLLDDQGQPKPEAEDDLHYRQLHSNGSRTFMTKEAGQEFLAAVGELGSPE